MNAISLQDSLKRWGLISLVAISTGLLVALFLWVLDKATEFRWRNEWIVHGLPLAGILIVMLYRYYGKGTEAGNNMLIDNINGDIPQGVPSRMIPMIIFSTIVTHLFGGSAGREGTAVQIGGSTAATITKLVKASNDDTKLLIKVGMAAGFGAVFGTPFSGAIFALEVLNLGRMRLHGLVPSLVASYVANLTTLACGVEHTDYHFDYSHTFEFKEILIIALAGLIFGLVARLYIITSDLVKSFFKFIHSPYLIITLGSAAVLLISHLLGTFDYLGLGVTTEYAKGISITSAFGSGGAEPFSWFWKLLLTAITLCVGFKGGEVTPLFFVGACLGNSLAVLSGGSVELFAGLGMIAVFAGATNTPIASVVLGIELFGLSYSYFYVVVCLLAYAVSGDKGIYQSQRVEVSKTVIWHWFSNKDEEDKLKQ